MDVETQERRESKRVFFSLEDDIRVNLNLPMSSIKAIPGILLSLSTGGLSIAASKSKRKNIREGDAILVSNLQLPDTYEEITGIEVEVKHIIYYKKFDRFTIGCEINKIPSQARDQIERFIDQRVVIESEEEEETGGITVF